MVDPRADSILYQTEAYILDLADNLVSNKRLGKALDKEWDKIDYILSIMEAYSDRAYLDDPDMVNGGLECLIQIANLYDYPAAPSYQMLNPPAIIAEKGDKGDKGDNGDPGPAGMATDKQVTISSTGVVDSFPVGSSKAVRWDYVVTRSTGEQRCGTILATWDPSGANIDFFDSCTEDILGATDDIEFEVQYSAGDIQLIAVILAGIWSVTITRYFIPNNGTGTGPISDNLPFGLIYIGNAADLAQARAVSGHLTLTFDGTLTLNANVILDSHINSNANINWTKMLELDTNKLAATNALGYITTINSPTLTEAAQLQGIESNVQEQIDIRLIDPTTNPGDIIYRSAIGTTRLPIGEEDQVLTVQGGYPQWLPADGPVISIRQEVVEVGDWDMSSFHNTSVPHGLLDYRKIISVLVVIRDDTDATYTPLNNAALSGAGTVEGGVSSWNSTVVFLERRNSGFYDMPTHQATGFNRGWMLITYRT